MLSCKHSKFTLNPGITYLNGAYMSPLLKSVEKAGVRGIRRKRNPALIGGDDFFTENMLLKNEFANLINAPDSKQIAIIPSASYGMATVSRNVRLKKGENIILASEQFPSNYYSWKKICEESDAELKIVYAPLTRTNRGREWNERILEAINERTKLVTLGHVHWADGTKFDLESLRKRTLEVGALLVIDGTQSVGALPLDVQSIKPDALIVAGYKWMLGPYSLGVAYYSDHFKNGIPIEENWINRKNSEDFAGLVIYQDEYKEGAHRFDVGEHSNFILVPMLLKALQQLNRWGPQNVQDYCGEITREAISLLKEKGYWIEDENFRCHHLFGIRLPEGADINHVKAKLQQKKIFVSYRGDAIRVSPNVYNDQADLIRFAKALISK